MNGSQRLVPWQKWEEWRYVKDLLYSNNYDDQMEGISIVKSWKCRCVSIPVAVESTSLFTELLMKLDSFVHETSIESDQYQYSELVYASSMAIIRMVNGLIDAEQKGLYSKSVNTIAEEIGLPRVFVDLRHRCTHMSIPSFELLYSALQEGKQWLFESYWNKQDATLIDHINSIIQQLIAVSRLASLSCDPSTFNRKGEVYQILKILFNNSSHNDFVDTIIPVLTGTSDYANLNGYPVVLPDLSNDKLDQSQWIQNWGKIITIASSHWNCFLDSFIEHALMFIVSDNSSNKTNEWLRCLIRFLFSKRFYTMRFQMKVIHDGVCTLSEIHEMGYFPERYIRVLLQSTDAVILDYLADVFNNYMVDEDRELLKIRREMSGLKRIEESSPSAPIHNKRLLELEKFVDEMDTPSILYGSRVVRYEYDDIPIGSILYSSVYSHKQMTLRN